MFSAILLNEDDQSIKSRLDYLLDKGLQIVSSHPVGSKSTLFILSKDDSATTKQQSRTASESVAKTASKEGDSDLLERLASLVEKHKSKEELMQRDLECLRSINKSTEGLTDGLKQGVSLFIDRLDELNAREYYTLAGSRLDLENVILDYRWDKFHRTHPVENDVELNTDDVCSR